MRGGELSTRARVKEPLAAVGRAHAHGHVRLEHLRGKSRCILGLVRAGVQLGHGQPAMPCQPQPCRSDCESSQPWKWAHPLPHLHRDWAHPLPHLHRDWAHPLPHLHRDWDLRPAVHRRGQPHPTAQSYGGHTGVCVCSECARLCVHEWGWATCIGARVSAAQRIWKGSTNGTGRGRRQRAPGTHRKKGE